MFKMNRCCCFALETGGLIIGVLEIIGGIIGVILSIVSLGVWTAIGQEIKDKDSKVFGTGGESELDEDKRQKAELGIYIINTFVIVFLIISCIQIIISSVLIHGIRKKSSTLMTVWTVFKIIFIIILVIMFILACFNGVSAVHIILYLLIIGLSTFYVKVIHDLKSHSQVDANGLPSYIQSQNKL